MTVKRFTKLPSGNATLDRIQDSLSTAISTHATQVDAHTTALANGLTFASNFLAEYLTVTVTTDATDLVTLPSLNAWVSVGAGNVCRKDSKGDVMLTINAKSGALATVVCTLPSNCLPLWDMNLPANANNGSGEIEITPNGNVTCYAGTVTNLLSGVWTFPSADRQPYVFACFPVTLSPTRVRAPVDVQLVSVTDTSTTPVTPALGHMSWQITKTGAVQITNIPGLLLGRTYSVKVRLIGG